MAGVMQHEVKLSESGEKCLLVGVEQEMATLIKQDRSFIRRPIDMLESVSYPCDIKSIANIRSISAFLAANLSFDGRLLGSANFLIR